MKTCRLPRLTPEEFISQCDEAHNSFYIYDKTSFMKIRDKVTITCPIHGDFEQPAGNHLKGMGCKQCAIEDKRNKAREGFIKRANKVHSNKYNYDKMIYVNMKSDIIVTCPIHGDFNIISGNHINGTGCKGCKGPKETFTEKVKRIHPDYIYTKLNYKNPRTDIIVTCKKHGNFIIRPNILLSGKGCKQCEKEETQKVDEENFFIQAPQVHNDKYNYDKVEYKHNKINVIITCPIHGDFEQQPNNHIRGSGCPACGRDNKKYTTTEFITSALAKHNNLYSYSNTIYTGSDNKVVITCPIHGDFEQVAGSHLHGAGCLKCAREKSGELKYKGKKTTIYYVYFPDYNLYKIGLTRKTIHNRFASEIKNNIKIDIIEYKEFEDGTAAFKLEQQILNEYKNKQYDGPPILQTGNTELFIEDILKNFNL